jgi:tripartite-type tricarboxylate transporter receptor subunit TctC
MNRKMMAVLAGLLMAGMLFANGTQEGSATPAPSFAGKNVRMVIGSTSTSGDSYLIADTTARYLAKYLGCNIKVDAVGAAKALDAMQTSKPDGNAIMMFHDMTYLGISFGAYDSMYSLENMTVGPEAAQNPISCWAAGINAPYNNLKEIPTYLKNNPKAVCRMACEAGGVSHIAFITYYEWVLKTFGKDVADRIVVVIGGSTGDKCQKLWDGNCDVIFADYTSLLQYTQTDDKKIAMKFMGLMDNVEGVAAPSYADLGISADGKEFRFSKDFIVYLPKDFPATLLAELDAAMKKTCEDPQYVADLAKMHYRPAYKASSDAKTFIYAKRAGLDSIIKNAPSLDDLVQK